MNSKIQNRREIIKLLGCVSASSLCACSYNPVNQRRQLNFVPDNIIKHMSDDYYYQFLSDNELVIVLYCSVLLRTA